MSEKFELWGGGGGGGGACYGDSTVVYGYCDSSFCKNLAKYLEFMIQPSLNIEYSISL